MKTPCPNCGAEVEFRYDDSFVRICAHCRNAVLRTDRGIESLGQVADLVPIESPLRLFADGHFGSSTFILVGMAQIRHSAGGIWQEWYAKLDSRWAWIAEAQGRYYLTFEQANVALPPLESLVPGSTVLLPSPGRPVPHAFTVAEVSTGTYLAAVGELPYKLVPQGTFRYADLSDGESTFATIDYGEDGDAPAVYVGQQVTLADLGVHGGEVGPSRDVNIAAKRLACPNCNAPIDVRVPGESLRVACAHCGSVLSVETEAAQLVAQQAKRPEFAIPLGSKAQLPEGEMTVVGFVQRSAFIDDTWWPFDEYLLHAPEIGFRWLVQSDGHWSYVQPIAPGAVASGSSRCRYDGVTFRRFQNAQLRVDQVLGEFYWRVEVGETVDSDDFVAPPAMLSRELAPNEETWSLSTYMTPADVQGAFGDKGLALPAPQGVAPNQPDRSARAGSAMTLGFCALLLVGLVANMLASHTKKYEHAVTIPAGAPPPPPADPIDPATAPPAADTAPSANVMFTDSFTLDAGKNVELGFSASLDNDWAYIAADLVNVATGEVSSVDADLEHYSGYEDGEAWSEGSSRSTRVIGPVAAGEYMLRLESQHGKPTGEVNASVIVRQGVFRIRYLGLACLVLGVPLLAFGLHTWSFERRRWENSSQGASGAPRSAAILLILVIGGVFVLIAAILKASSSSSK